MAAEGVTLVAAAEDGLSVARVLFDHFHQRENELTTKDFTFCVRLITWFSSPAGVFSSSPELIDYMHISVPVTGICVGKFFTSIAR